MSIKRPVTGATLSSAAETPRFLTGSSCAFSPYVKSSHYHGSDPTLGDSNAMAHLLNPWVSNTMIKPVIDLDPIVSHCVQRPVPTLPSHRIIRCPSQIGHLELIPEAHCSDCVVPRAEAATFNFEVHLVYARKCIAVQSWIVVFSRGIVEKSIALQYARRVYMDHQ